MCTRRLSSETHTATGFNKPIPRRQVTVQRDVSPLFPEHWIGRCSSQVHNSGDPSKSFSAMVETKPSSRVFRPHSLCKAETFRFWCARLKSRALTSTYPYRQLGLVQEMPNGLEQTPEQSNRRPPPISIPLPASNTFDLYSRCKSKTISPSVAVSPTRNSCRWPTYQIDEQTSAYASSQSQ